MNKRLASEILSIAKKINKDEAKAFYKYSLRKEPSNGKEHRYVKLFKLYQKQTDNLDIEENVLKKEAALFTKSLDDLNQKLHAELIKFIAENYREVNSDETEAKIEEFLDNGAALFEKGLYSISIKNILSAVDLLKEVHKENLKERTLYLSLRAFALLMQVRYRVELNKKDERTIEEFELIIRPFTNIARNSYYALAESDKVDSFNNEDFNKSTFYGLLNIYNHERVLFEYDLKGRGGMGAFSFALQGLGKDKKIGLNEKNAQEELIDVESYLFQIERMYKAILSNDISDFESAYESTKHKLFHAFSMKEFNLELSIFIYRQLFELKTIFTLKNDQVPLDINGLVELENISRKKIELFNENEILDFPLRMELNAFVILFLSKNYEELNKRIESFEKNVKKNIYKDYYIDIRLMDILCRIDKGQVHDDEFIKRTDYYESFIKKNPCTEFHKKFNGFFNAYIGSPANDRKTICKKYVLKLENVEDELNHFQAVYLNWLKNKI